MPEGPEVKRNVDYLNSVLQGTRILDVQINSGRYIKHGPFKGYDVISDEMLVVDEVCCKGKFIYWTMENGFIIFHTLGMSGTWRIQNKSPKHGRLSFVREDGKPVSYTHLTLPTKRIV